MKVKFIIASVLLFLHVAATLFVWGCVLAVGGSGFAMLVFIGIPLVLLLIHLSDYFDKYQGAFKKRKTRTR